MNIMQALDQELDEAPDMVQQAMRVLTSYIGQTEFQLTELTRQRDTLRDEYNHANLYNKQLYRNLQHAQTMNDSLRDWVRTLINQNDWLLAFAGLLDRRDWPDWMLPAAPADVWEPELEPRCTCCKATLWFGFCGVCEEAHCKRCEH